MKIIFISKNKERNLRVPLSFLFFFIRFLPVKKEKLTKKVMRLILRTIKEYKKRYGPFVLLELEEDSTQKLKIVI